MFQQNFFAGRSLLVVIFPFVFLLHFTSLVLPKQTKQTKASGIVAVASFLANSSEIINNKTLQKLCALIFAAFTFIVELFCG